MSFSEAWLRRREPYDHAARHEGLAQRFVDLMQGERVLDLGGGTGSGARYLRRLDASLDVWVVDHDRALLATAAEQGFATQVADLRQWEELPDAGGLHCQALLDLVSWDWLQAWITQLIEEPVPLLAALTVDGRVRFSPEDRDDEEVLSCFRAHQSLDRGFGPSPGTRAAPTLARRLMQAGWDVVVEPADWRIPATDVDMVRIMVDGISEAAAEMAIQPARVHAWAERRSGGLTVGHLDILAIPPSRQRRA